MATTRNQKNEKVREAMKHAVAEFLNLESNRLSLITVTDLRLSERRTGATIFLTVLPETKEGDALEFANRRRTALSAYLMKKIDMQRIPRLTFAIDLGEKNRQRIEMLSQKA